MTNKDSSPVSELVAKLSDPDLWHRDELEYIDPLCKQAAASLTSLSAEVARKDAEIERLRGRLRMAEFMMTKDSLCEAERLEEGLHCVRAALSAPKGGEHV